MSNLGDMLREPFSTFLVIITSKKSEFLFVSILDLTRKNK